MSHYAAFPRSRYVQARVAEADVDAAEAAFLLLTMDQRHVEVQRIASLSDEDLYAEVLVATSTVQQVLDWVGADVERADSAYAAESRGAQRTTLLEPLAALIGDDPAPAPPLPSPFVRASEKGVAGGVAALDGAGDVVTAAGKKLLTQEAGSSTYVPAFPEAVTVVPDADGNVESVTEDGITTTFTYNADGSVATDTRLGVTRSYTYDAAGNLTSIEAVA